MNDNAFLNKYSEINYDRANLHENHRRVQRSLDSHIKLTLRTDNKEFNLKLKPSTKSNFNNKHIEVISTSKKLVKTPENSNYEGYLIEEPDSSIVTGSIINGLFIGTIESKKSGKYQIESAQQFAFSGKTATCVSFDL